MTPAAPRARFLGLPLDPLDMDSTVRDVERRVDGRVPGAHLGLNAANVVAAQRDPAYRADLEAADIVTADGQSVVWGARVHGIAVPERVTGIDLMQRLLRASRQHDWGIYLLGSTPRVVGRLAERLAAEGTRVCGHRDGYFSAADAPDIARAVRASGATLLFVGTPSPHKERFIIGQARPAGVPFSVGVGGAFDVLAGELRRAPPIVQRIGLEWAFRLFQEPRRLFGRYAVTNTRYLLLLVGGAVRRKRRRNDR